MSKTGEWRTAEQRMQLRLQEARFEAWKADTEVEAAVWKVWRAREALFDVKGKGLGYKEVMAALRAWRESRKMETATRKARENAWVKAYKMVNDASN